MVTEPAVLFDTDDFGELFDAVKLTVSFSLNMLTDHFLLEITPAVATCSDNLNDLGSVCVLEAVTLELLSANVMIA